MHPTAGDGAYVHDRALSGGQIGADFVPMLLEELAMDGDLRAPDWVASELAPGRPFRVVVIGAGMSIAPVAMTAP